MQHRRFGSLEWESSALGFGCMRLPTRGANTEDIDEGLATRMIRYAIDCGVSFIDTAYPYHGGNSEKVLGRVLQEGYRAKVKLATKLPMWLVERTEDFDRFLNEQLARLQTDHIDFYLFHGLDAGRWAKVQSLQLLACAERARSDGRIGGIGFSFHDTYAAFQEIIDGYNGWVLCLIQYNYMGTDNQAGRRGLEYAASRGLAVVVMEPLLGGKLATPPPHIQALLDRELPGRGAADLSLQWLWSQAEVATVISGMSTLAQVEQNIQSADASGIDTFSEGELALVERIRAESERLSLVPCTYCEYCLPCPEGVYIPRIFRLFNEGYMYGDAPKARDWYGHWLKEEQRADCCVQCHDCENKCPQRVPISQWMPRVHRVLAGEAEYSEVPIQSP